MDQTIHNQSCYTSVETKNMSGSNDLVELNDDAAKPTTKPNSDDGEVEVDSSLVQRAIDQFPSDSNMDIEEGKVPIEQDRQSSGKRTAYKSKKTGSPPPKSKVSFGEDAPEVHHLDDEQEEKDGRLSMVSKMYDIDGDGKLGMFVLPCDVCLHQDVHIICSVFSLKNIV